MKVEHFSAKLYIHQIEKKHNILGSDIGWNVLNLKNENHFRYMYVHANDSTKYFFTNSNGNHSESNHDNNFLSTIMINNDDSVTSMITMDNALEEHKE